jgi:hypothetical protein
LGLVALVGGHRFGRLCPVGGRHSGALYLVGVESAGACVFAFAGANPGTNGRRCRRKPFVGFTYGVGFVGSGPRGRRFESCRPDLQSKSIQQNDLRNGRSGGRSRFLGE